MSNIEAAEFFDEFESEAKAHIAAIELAFLDLNALNSSNALLDGVFRAAHSLKGTAGFFSFDKIVAVAHELESVFSRVKNGELRLTEEIADVALESVDVLKALTDNLNSPESVDTGYILGLLSQYSDSRQSADISWGTKMTFDITEAETQSALKAELKRGRRIYYICVGSISDLGRYAQRPVGLVEEILSIGSILNISFGGANINASALSGNTLEGMANGGISQLCFLISSVLEPELFLIAIELDSRLIQPIPKEAILGQDPAPPAKKTENRAAAKPYAQKADFSIRLDISFINNFMDVANEMILTRNRLMTLTRAHAKSITGLTPVLNSVSRLTSEVQEKVMRARMQPVGVIFNKFPRIIRDAAKTLGKDIRLEISGADIALDKYMLDSLTDPITQIVKNAADHGIESAERRAKAQKPPQGSIALNACMRDGMAVIEITDDGAGIDPERLKQTAMERGAFSEERLAAMTKDELFALIFEPGLSTAKQITSVSGRGVGMDIVKTNIERLGGTIEIESTPNAGTAMRIKVPLTLSVVRTLIIKIDGVQYAVPESNVARIVRVSTKSASQFAWVNGSPIINIDGWIVPLITLCGDAPDGELPEYVNPDAAKCLILKSGSRYFALLIEDALETEETLIKPLPIYLKSCRIYSGVTVLGSGSAIMVLDARGLLRSSGLSGVEMPPEESAAPAENTEQVIVFACSGPEYYAVNANYVTRIVRFEAGRIQEIDDALYVSIADKAIRLIRTEDYAPVQKLPYLKKWLYLVLLDSGAQPAGLLADHVLDKVQAVLPLDNNVAEGDYILGTSVHGEKILIHLDSARILEAALLHENLAVAERRCASSEA